MMFSKTGWMNPLKFFLAAVFIAAAPADGHSGGVFPFEGRMDLSDSEVTMVLDLDGQGSAAARAQKLSGTEYRFSLDVDHLKTPFFDLTSRIESSVEIIRGTDDSRAAPGGAVVRGEVWSRYSLVDYKPVRELSGRFEVRDKRLYVTSLSFGNFGCAGYVDLAPPHKFDLVLHLAGVGMNDFLSFWTGGEKYESSGAVSGEIKASGTLERLALKGSLESRRGFVRKLDYDVISLNVEGVYPHMQIVNSIISRSDGASFTLDGPFNLKDKDNFGKQIKALTLAPLVRDSGTEMEWTIKRLNPQDSGTVELKYRYKKGDALETGPSAGNGIDMLGVERTRKF